MSAWASFLTWIEESTFGHFIRGLGVWSYGIINLMHIFGIALLFGSVLIFDLRLLGWRRRLSIAHIADVTVPIAATGFFVAIIAGVCMLATNGSEYIGNPFLPIKLAAIGLGIVNALIAHRLPMWKRVRTGDSVAGDEGRMAVVGALSLFFWLAAVTAGRLIAYY